MSKSRKISSKGQVTIPKNIRNYLGTDTVEFIVEEEKVVIKAVKNVAGKLHKYAKPDLVQHEKTGWKKAVLEKHDDR